MHVLVLLTKVAQRRTHDLGAKLRIKVVECFYVQVRFVLSIRSVDQHLQDESPAENGLRTAPIIAQRQQQARLE